MTQTRNRYDNIKVNFEEIACGSVDWIYLAYDRNWQ
jgi:hypothetical protein